MKRTRSADTAGRQRAKARTTEKTENPKTRKTSKQKKHPNIPAKGDKKRPPSSLITSLDLRQRVSNPAMERKRVLPHSVFQPIERQKANLIKTRTRMGIFVFKRNLVPSVPNRVTESKTDQPPLSSSHSVTKTQDNLLHHCFDRIREGDVDTPPIKEPTPNLPTPGAAKHHMAKIFHLCFTEHTKPICLFMQDMPLEKILSSRKLVKTPTPQKTA
ncbi:hypothetical protein Ancab_039786 [Ancistrocladus abbreviatus]